MSIKELLKALQGGPGPEGEWWPQEPGDTAAGRVDGFESQPARYNRTVMHLISEDQEESRVPVVHSVLKSVSVDREVEIGDLVAIRYDCTRTSRAGRTYRACRVEHEPLGPWDNSLRLQAEAPQDAQ